VTGEGIDHLLSAIEDRLARGRSHLELTLDASDGQGLHWLYEHAEVMSRSDGEDGLRLTIRVPPDQIDRIKRRFPAGRRLSPSPPADA
jgi:GTP-binding protein HflX